MARLAPLTVAEVDAAVKTWRADLVTEGDRSPDEVRSQLRELHELLLRVTPSGDEPRDTLELVAEVIATVDAEVVERLPPRPRIVLRLLGAGRTAAAWQVLIDNAAARTPLRVRVEAPAVFAELPGFRDPRFGVSDASYDLADRMRLRAQLGEIEVHSDAGLVRLGGWAVLDLLDSSPEQEARLVLVRHGREVAVAAARVRRSDRRAWAGWSASVDVRDGAALDVGRWGLSIEINHEGVVRRAALGADSTDVARVTALGAADVGGRTVRWDTTRGRWQLVLDERRPTQWGGVLRRTP